MKRLRLVAAAAALVVLFVLLLRQERDASSGDLRAAPAAEEPRAGFEPPVQAIDAPSAAPIAPTAEFVATAPSATLATRSVTGRVTRASDGLPMASAKVECSQDFDRFDTLTAEDGTFRLDGLSPDAAMLGFRSQQGDSCQSPLEGGTHDVLDRQVLLDTGFRIAGTVRDEFGGPIAGAEVEVATRGVRGRTDAQGQFLLADVEASRGALIEVRARTPGHVWQGAEVLAPDDRREIASVELRLASAGLVEGVVSGPDGAPLAYLSVAVDSAQDEQQAVPHTESDAQGHYALDGLRPGRYVLRFGDEWSEWSTGERVIRELPPTWIPDVVVTAGAVTSLDVRVPAGARIDGHVRDAQGVPIVGAQLEMSRSDIDADGHVLQSRCARAISDADGHYALERLPAGRLRLRVAAPETSLELQQRDFELRGGEQLHDVDFVLGAGRMLEGRVLDPAGLPVPYVHVCVGDGPDPDFREVAETDATGSFRAAGLTPGPHLFAFRQNLNMPDLHGWVEATLDAAASPVVVTVPSAPKLQVQVLDASTGRPVTSFGFRVEFAGFRNRQDAEDHADGTLVVGVPCARCDVTIAADRYETQSLRDVDVTGLGTEPLTFRLVPRP